MSVGGFYTSAFQTFDFQVFAFQAFAFQTFAFQTDREFVQNLILLFLYLSP